MTTKSKSKAEDDRKLEAAPDRVTKAHGGQLVEAISFDQLEPMNDPNCKHEKLVRDESETDFNAFTCANTRCNEVFLFDKQ